MFIAALFRTAPNWKQLNCPLFGEWINKLWNILPCNVITVIRNKLLIYATRMNLKSTMLSERRQNTTY